MNAPDSLLLRAETTPISAPSQLQAARSNGSYKAFTQIGQPGCDEVSAVPEHLLTLALTPENFSTALVHTMEANGAGKLKHAEQLKESVEVLMYRLAAKDPLAFPEVFSLVSVPENAEEECRVSAEEEELIDLL